MVMDRSASDHIARDTYVIRVVYIPSIVRPTNNLYILERMYRKREKVWWLFILTFLLRFTVRFTISEWTRVMLRFHSYWTVFRTSFMFTQTERDENVDI